MRGWPGPTGSGNIISLNDFQLLDDDDETRFERLPDETQDDDTKLKWAACIIIICTCRLTRLTHS